MTSPFQDLRTLAAYALALLLLATFVSHSWCAPKVWAHVCSCCLSTVFVSKTAYTITFGQRFVSEDRNEGDLYDTIRLESRSQNTENLSISKAAAFLLNVLQQARDEGEPY
uniref:Spexin-like n=1 Tax=Sinocyclocheilus anshuiensis TaxID=1608454 RepID=A0A671R4M5_9TELE